MFASASPPRAARSLGPHRLLFAVAAGLVAANAHAHVFCVGVAQELQDAFAAAGTTYANEDNFIQLKNGLYTNGTATGGCAWKVCIAVPCALTR